MVHAVSCNCFVCAKEFDPNELNNLVLSKINVTNFKICQGCLDKCNPSEDYREVREIINSYLSFNKPENKKNIDSFDIDIEL